MKADWQASYARDEQIQVLRTHADKGCSKSAARLAVLENDQANYLRTNVKAGCSASADRLASLERDQLVRTLTTNANAGCSKSAAKLAELQARPVATGSCSKSKAQATLASNGAGCSKSAKAAQASGCSKSAKTATMARTWRTGQKVSLTGHVVCGDCDLQTSKGCVTMLKLEDGETLPLSGNRARALKTAASGGAVPVEVTGRIRRGGTLQVKSYELRGGAIGM
ncbi:MAG: hypothetical protein AAF533_00520 [Acidobacteriota bacterium]